MMSIGSTHKNVGRQKRRKNKRWCFRIWIPTDNWVEFHIEITGEALQTDVNTQMAIGRYKETKPHFNQFFQSYIYTVCYIYIYIWRDIFILLYVRHPPFILYNKKQMSLNEMRWYFLPLIQWLEWSTFSNCTYTTTPSSKIISI